MIRNFPLMILPLIVYNLFAFEIIGGAVEGFWSGEVFGWTLASGARWAVTLGDALIIGALVLLFVELMKATRTAQATIVDHLLSTLVFIGYLVEFIVIKQAATSIFFIVMMLTLLDVIAGYSISIRVASRDVTLDRGL